MVPSNSNSWFTPSQPYMRRSASADVKLKLAVDTLLSGTGFQGSAAELPYSTDRAFWHTTISAALASEPPMGTRLVMVSPMESSAAPNTADHT